MIAVAAVLVVLCGCKEKKQSDNIISVDDSETVSIAPSGPVRMQAFKQSTAVKWVGRTYTVDIERHANDSLPMVRDEEGDEYVDNSIRLRVVRADGSVFFSKVFTKHTFEAYLDEAYRKRGILEGLVFDGVDGNSLKFASSVSFPQTDEYIPLEVMVDNFGNVSIRRENSMDTYGNVSETSAEASDDDEDADDDF